MTRDFKKDYQSGFRIGQGDYMVIEGMNMIPPLTKVPQISCTMIRVYHDHDRRGISTMPIFLKIWINVKSVFARLVSARYQCYDCLAKRQSLDLMDILARSKETSALRI